MKIQLARPDLPPFDVPDANLLGVFKAHDATAPRPLAEIMPEALAAPVGTPRLRDMVRAGTKTLVLCDDLTRPTPADQLLPHVLAELHAGGARVEDIRIMIAGGSHEPHNAAQMAQKVGAAVMAKYRVAPHIHDDAAHLAYLGLSSQGIPIWVNKALLEADVVLAVGGIKAHAAAGFSGGCKMVCPGMAGKATIQAMHYIEHQRPPDPLIGDVNSPIRQFLEEVGQKAGLDAIVNFVPDTAGQPASAVVGHPIAAHREAVRRFREINGTPIPAQADIVIADMSPVDTTLMATVFPSSLAVRTLKDGGVLILVAALAAGTKTPGADDFYGMLGMDDAGCSHLRDAAWVLAQEWPVTVKVGAWCGLRFTQLFKRWHGILVSANVTPEQKRKMDFGHAADVPQALAMAFALRGPDASVLVLERAGKLFPTFANGNGHF